MPERRVQTEQWSSGWFQALDKDQRYLCLYLELNQHCSQSGLYPITLDTIAFEAKIEAAALPDLLKSLSPVIEWYPDQSMVWVRDFIRKQSFSPTFWKAAGKSLERLSNNGLAADVIAYNETSHGIKIPYRYPIDTVEGGSQSQSQPLSQSKSRSLSGKPGGSGGDEEVDRITAEFRKNIGEVTPVVAAELMEIAGAYPPGWFGDALKEALSSGHHSLRYISSILKRWQKEGKGPGKKTGVQAHDPDKYIKGKYGHMVRR
ncbi:hypothetical protein LCGC14_0632290 [marine sediment metagenome]|uniref:DnaB/C C-terminal domain-containing protein n=1 Tax=marine sediment metagenome TaxID=412755 RepID=A0A0F9R6W8_9ZZZZ